MSPQNSLQHLLQQLEQQQQAGEKNGYLELESDDPAHYREFFFKGYFQQRPVIWHVHLYSKITADASQDYEIQQLEDGLYRIAVHLAREQLHDRDVLMTMKMISQYRNLKIGQHFWHG